MAVHDKRVLVTGGTGTLGQAVVRRLLSGAAGRPAKITVFSRDESKQHDMRVALRSTLPAATDEIAYRDASAQVDFQIGDVRRIEDLVGPLSRADVVIHAAALKQVPSCEYFVEQAVLTNCLGAANIVRAIHDHRLPVEAVVGVSTDKACKPINAMGMTKALQERIFIAANIASPGARYVLVRYGNVIASRGSAIPLFLEQIRAGGPVTLTDPAMTRFLLSTDDAVDAILTALARAAPGEIVVPAAPGARMVDVVAALCEGRDVRVEVTGVRPGEKLHESLIAAEEAARTRVLDGYYVIAPMLPELAAASPQGAPGLAGEYASDHTVLDRAGVAALLRRHGLTDGRGHG